MINIIKILFCILTMTTKEKTHVAAFRVVTVNDEYTIIAMSNETISIEYKSHTPLTYCAFLNPTGKRYSYSGPLLTAGQCFKEINISLSDKGTWYCHVGIEGNHLEIVQKIEIRVVLSEIAAEQKYIKAVHGKSITITCLTVSGLNPLNYCRFGPPNGQTFSIDSEVTAENAILNRYYFPTNKSLDRGDCAVTIRKVKYEDVGLWTCGAGLNDGQEHIDVVRIDMEGLQAKSSVSITGIAVGVLCIISLVAILCFVAWKKRSISSTRRGPHIVEVHELEQLPTVSTRVPRGTLSSAEPMPSSSLSS